MPTTGKTIFMVAEVMSGVTGMVSVGFGDGLG